MIALKSYSDILTATVNRKGVLDVDTVKGCHFGMKKYPNGGCYGLCYAAKSASVYGFDFSKSVVRKKINCAPIEKSIKYHRLPWFRVGTMGDPSYDWDFTVMVCEWLGRFSIPVIVTKHWIALSNAHIRILKKCNAVINTSISPLDSESEIEYRMNTYKLLNDLGVRSVLRVAAIPSCIKA